MLGFNKHTGTWAEDQILSLIERVFEEGEQR